MLVLAATVAHSVIMNTASTTPQSASARYTSNKVKQHNATEHTNSLQCTLSDSNKKQCT
jgi:hypothetical protein